MNTQHNLELLKRKAYPVAYLEKLARMKKKKKGSIEPRLRGEKAKRPGSSAVVLFKILNEV